MTHVIRPILLCALLAGCASGGLPDSNPDFSAGRADIGRGVGFGDYEAYEARRLGQAPGGPAVPGPVVANATSPAISADELRAAGLPAGGGTLPQTGPVAATPLPSAGGVAAGPVTPAPAPSNGTAISDEQSFAAVSGRETIESDAERLARQRAQYQVIQPGALPQRQGPSGPNIVQFALSSSNVVGQQIYRRGGLFGPKDPARACAQYASADLAQEAFLAAGGPQRDKMGVDPDGDGFACGWNPAPFRAARG